MYALLSIESFVAVFVRYSLVFNMVNAVYHEKPLIIIGDKFREKLFSHHQAVNMNKLMNILDFIMAVSDNVLDMINAVYHEKPLVFIGATFREKLFSHHQAVNEADSCLHMRRTGLKAMARTKANFESETIETYLSASCRICGTLKNFLKWSKTLRTPCRRLAISPYCLLRVNDLKEKQ